MSEELKKQGAESALEPQLNGPLKFGDYTHDFMDREAELLIGGDISRLGRHTQTFVNYLFTAYFMKLKKRGNDTEIVLEGLDARMSTLAASLDNLQSKIDGLKDSQAAVEKLEKRLKSLEKELGS